MRYKGDFPLLSTLLLGKALLGLVTGWTGQTSITGNWHGS
jgi:hypothetical protein